MNPGNIARLLPSTRPILPIQLPAAPMPPLRDAGSNGKNTPRFRNIGQGSRCKICSRLDEEQVQATTPEDKKQPALHVTGVVLHGWMEAYFLLPSDCAKDANMNCSLLRRMFDLFRENFLDEYIARNCIISADNTPRESKNQWMASYLAACVGSRCSTRRSYSSSRLATVTTNWTNDSPALLLCFKELRIWKMLRR